MRILLIEDNLRMATLLREGIEGTGHQVDMVHTRSAALHAATCFGHALWILDIGLPDGDGLELLRTLRRKGFAQPCLILTARDALHDRVDGLEAGADDYLPKPFAMEELLARVNALLRRPQTLLPARLSFADIGVDMPAQCCTANGVTLQLPIRELAALECLLRAPQHRCSREQLENHVYGMAQAVTPNALEVLLHRLRRRLVDSGARTTIRALRGYGYELAHH